MKRNRKKKTMEKMNQKTKNNHNIVKTLVLWAFILLFSVSGIWLLVSPTLEKQVTLGEQDRLLEEVEANSANSVAVEARDIAYDGGVEPDVFIPTTVDIPIPDNSNEISLPTVKPPVLENSGLTAIGILEINKIDLKLPVVCGVTEEQLKIAAGLVPETVSIGELGNAVIAGHRSYTYGVHFNRLGEMAIGDNITYTPKDGESINFEVFEITEITPGDQIAFVQPKDESIITLYTCTPIKTATHRLLVRAKKI